MNIYCKLGLLYQEMPSKNMAIKMSILILKL